MIPHLVHKIEGGYPERDIGAEEGQGWGDSRRLMGNTFPAIRKTMHAKRRRAPLKWRGVIYQEGISIVNIHS